MPQKPRRQHTRTKRAGGPRKRRATGPRPQADSPIARLLREGIRHFRAGRLAQAEQAYRRALARDPDNAEALSLLGFLAFHVGQNETAVALIGRAAEIDGGKPDYHANLAAALARLGRLDEAVARCRQALSVDPGYADARYNLALYLQRLDRLDEAVEQYRALLRARPRDAQALSNLGVALNELGRVEEAIETYRRALAIAPADAVAHQNLAHALLKKGTYAEGWAEYEWRWRNPHFPSPRRDFRQPLWDGGPLGERVVLLHAEQGLGDTLQFIRYAPLVAARGGRVVVECQAPLASLIAGCSGVERVVVAGEALPPFDVHAPLLGLPRLLGTTPETIPADVPYLAAPPGHPLGACVDGTTGLRVGLVWSGNPAVANNHKRSCPLAALAPLFEVAGVTFFSLQKGPAAAELGRVGGRVPAAERVVDLADRLDDFADTAAAMERLDLVISVDTAAAHLAGALARPLWLLLHTGSDWRWMTERADSPWYPTARLFRQRRPGDWAGVALALRDALAALAARRTAA